MNPFTELREEIQAVQPHTVEQVMLMIKHFESEWDKNQLTPEESTKSKDGLQIIHKYGQPYGIRNNGGYLLFFSKITKYDGQEERYISEIKEAFELSEKIIEALKKEEVNQSKWISVKTPPENLVNVQLAVKRDSDVYVTRGYRVGKVYTVMTYSGSREFKEENIKGWQPLPKSP